MYSTLFRYYIQKKSHASDATSVIFNLTNFKENSQSNGLTINLLEFFHSVLKCSPVKNERWPQRKGTKFSFFFSNSIRFKYSVSFGAKYMGGELMETVWPEK